MVNELGYSSHRVAEERLRVANALPALPAITQAIQNGNLNFSQAKELVRVATPETEKAWIEKAKEMNVREVEQAVAGHCKSDLPDDPVDPRLVRKPLWLSVRPETEVLVTEMTPAAVERAQCDAQWIGDLESNIVERARQEISAAMRRKVLHRDQKRCQVPGCLSHTTSMFTTFISSCMAARTSC
jgi:hypothetical protein